MFRLTGAGDIEPGSFGGLGGFVGGAQCGEGFLVFVVGEVLEYEVCFQCVAGLGFSCSGVQVLGVREGGGDAVSGQYQCDRQVAGCGQCVGQLPGVFLAGVGGADQQPGQRGRVVVGVLVCFHEEFAEVS